MTEGRITASNRSLLWLAGLVVGSLAIALLVIASGGVSDPVEGAARGQSAVTVMVNASVIVFREGLEAILILAAVTASFLGARRGYRRPVAIGAAAAFGVTVLTWFAMRGVLSVVPLSQDVLLALTGLVAIIVLLLVMNWFFHKLYWTQWIGKHNAEKRRLVARAEEDGAPGSLDAKAWWGFVALGFTSVYREGFEVVLFLQNLQIQAGTAVVLQGVALGLAGTAAVGVLTFLLHHKLPYKRMLVLTGVMLGAVLVIMTGGTARTFQDLGWLSRTPIGVEFPEWWARWFELVATVETLGMQALAGAFVIGSYYLAEHLKRRGRSAQPAPARETRHAGVPARPASQAIGAAGPAAPAAALRATSHGCDTAAIAAVHHGLVSEGVVPNEAAAMRADAARVAGQHSARRQQLLAREPAALFEVPRLAAPRLATVAAAPTVSPPRPAAMVTGSAPLARSAVAPEPRAALFGASSTFTREPVIGAGGVFGQRLAGRTSNRREMGATH